MALVSIDSMRKSIADRYTGSEWKRKVEKMSDRQVFAIFRRFVAEENKRIKEKNKAYAKRRAEKIARERDETASESHVVQISFEDIYQNEGRVC